MNISFAGKIKWHLQLFTANPCHAAHSHMRLVLSHRPTQIQSSNKPVDSNLLATCERVDLAYLCQERIGSLKVPGGHRLCSCVAEGQMACTTFHNSAFSSPVKCRGGTGLEAAGLQHSHFLYCPGRTDRGNVFFVWILPFFSWLSNFTPNSWACEVEPYLFLSIMVFKYLERHHI